MRFIVSEAKPNENSETRLANSHHTKINFLRNIQHRKNRFFLCVSIHSRKFNYSIGRRLVARHASSVWLPVTHTSTAIEWQRWGYRIHTPNCN
jgi:hypothetical protein